MQQLFRRFLFISLSAALFAAGCAKQELVKKDELVPQAVQAKPAIAATANTVANDTGIKEQSIKESQIKDQAAATAAADAKSDASRQAALEKIFFDFNSYTLSPAARNTMAKDAAVLQQKTAIKVRIEGYCDEQGSDEYNLALGEKRAKEAMKYLVAMGISPERLSILSYGKEKPADSGHNEAAWAKSRRDEFVIVQQ